jgi:hypothetical protein
MEACFMSSDDLYITDQHINIYLDPQARIIQLSSPYLFGNTLSFAEGDQSPILTYHILAENGVAVNPLTRFDVTRISNQAVHFHGVSDELSLDFQVSLAEYNSCYEISLANFGEQTVSAFDYQLNIPPWFAEGMDCTIPFCSGRKIGLSRIERDFTLQYPSQGAMQWVSVYTSGYGIYLGVHDPLPFFKELTIGLAGGVPFVRWRFPDLDLKRGENVTLPPLILAAHPGDWRGGANIYRKWARKVIHPASVPDWYRKKPSWAWVGLKGQHAETPWKLTSDLPHISRLASRAGVSLIQLTAYTEKGHDTLYPDYRPGTSIGGDDGFYNAIDEIHKDGRFLSLYVNGRLVDPASSVKTEKRQEWAVYPAPGGEPYRETYGSVTFDVMCPGARDWRNLFRRRLVELVARYDIDGIYIDQVCGCRSYPCYAGWHDHPKPNLAWSYYKQFLSEIRQLLQDFKPDVFLAAEGVNDIFGQYFDSMQAHNDWLGPAGSAGERLDELYRYTFPEHILNSGCITAESGSHETIKKAHIWGTGCDFGVFDWNEFPSTLADQVHIVLDWYERHHALFQSHPGVPVPNYPGGIQSRAFLSGEKMVINTAWFGAAGQLERPKTVDFMPPISTWRRIRSASTFPPGLPAPEYKRLPNQQWVMSAPFSEILGLELKLSV